MSNAMKYREDFCKHNDCTPAEFEVAYIAFMQTDPQPRHYRRFARKWGIPIYRAPGPGGRNAEAALSVNVAAIKVLAASNAKAAEAIQYMLSSINSEDA